MSKPKQVIDYKITRKECDMLARGKKFRMVLHPGDFGLVSKKLDLEGVTASEIFRLEERFKRSTALYLVHRKQRWGRAQCTGMGYKRHNLYAIYSVIEVHQPDVVKENGLPSRE